MMNTTVTVNELEVKSIYTTNNPASASNGAMTLTCQVNGQTVSVRTEVLHDAEGKLIVADDLNGKIPYYI